MPGCSLREAFPEFPKSVNNNPKLPPGVQRFGIEVDKNESTSPPGEKVLFKDPRIPKEQDIIENFKSEPAEYNNMTKPYADSANYQKNVAAFELPTNIEKMLETSINDMPMKMNYPTEINYSFDKNPYHINCVNDKLIIHIKDCQKCREKMSGIISRNEPNVIMRESNNPRDQMIEFTTFIAAGIFILFVLDMLKRSK